jgi:hypothetical protein
LDANSKCLQLGFHTSEGNKDVSNAAKAVQEADYDTNDDEKHKNCSTVRLIGASAPLKKDSGIRKA